jgi:porin
VAHLVYAYLEQSLMHDRLDVAAGWLPVSTYFASSPLYCDFINVLFCGNPNPLPNYPTEDDWPQATLGGQARYLITPQFYVMAGLFSVDPNVGIGGG